MSEACHSIQDKKQYFFFFSKVDSCGDYGFDVYSYFEGISKKGILNLIP